MGICKKNHFSRGLHARQRLCEQDAPLLILIGVVVFDFRINLLGVLIADEDRF